MKDLYKCLVTGCEKFYISSTILKRHLLAFHGSVNKFMCEICKKPLASRQNLKEHKFTHTREKPYKCEEPGCLMTFRQGTHLSAHKKSHQKKFYGLNIQKILEVFWCQEFHDDVSIKNPSFSLPAFRTSSKFI